MNEWAGGFEKEGCPLCPHIPPALPLRPVSMSRHPFCEHVLQHSCCSTFLWQRLFFLTSTQKLPSAQDSSFAFHRPGRRETGGVWRDGHACTHTNTCGNTHRAEPLETVEWQAEPCDWSGEGTGNRRVFIQSQVMFIEVENDCSPVD